MQVRGSWKLAICDGKRCQLSSVASLSHWASTLFIYSTFVVMQRVARVCLCYCDISISEITSYCCHLLWMYCFHRRLSVCFSAC